MLKKVLLELATRSAHSFFPGAPSAMPSSSPPRNTDYAPKESAHSHRAAQYKYALEMRLMISSYLRVLSEIMLGVRTAPSLAKLYNELYLSDEAWNEMVRHYLIGLFTVDINIFIP